MNKYRIGSKFQLSSLSTMFCSVLTGNGSCCALCSEGRGGGVLTGGRGRPAREDQSEDAWGGAMGMVIVRHGRCAAVMPRCCDCCLHGHSTDDLATQLGITGERGGGVSQ
jgi:hypothetical protein